MKAELAAAGTDHRRFPGVIRRAAANRRASPWSCYSGLTVAFISPPGLLSLLDGAVGGGTGASRPGSAIPFGTHGQTLDVWRPAGKSRCEAAGADLLVWRRLG